MRGCPSLGPASRSVEDGLGLGLNVGPLRKANMGTLRRIQPRLPNEAISIIRSFLEPQLWPSRLAKLAGEPEEIIWISPEDWPKLEGLWVHLYKRVERKCILVRGIVYREDGRLFVKGAWHMEAPLEDYEPDPRDDSIDFCAAENVTLAHMNAWRAFHDRELALSLRLEGLQGMTTGWAGPQLSGLRCPWLFKASMRNTETLYCDSGSYPPGAGTPVHPARASRARLCQKARGCMRDDHAGEPLSFFVFRGPQRNVFCPQ
jgi:hypothetical protein